MPLSLRFYSNNFEEYDDQNKSMNKILKKKQTQRSQRDVVIFKLERKKPNLNLESWYKEYNWQTDLISAKQFKTDFKSVYERFWSP